VRPGNDHRVLAEGINDDAFAFDMVADDQKGFDNQLQLSAVLLFLTS
jgi:hypothetical protein